MITPQRIQDIADPIEEIYIHIVDELLVNIGRHITSPTWTHTAAWEVQKLSELGQLTAENAAIINKWIKQMPREVRDTMEATRSAALDRLEKEMEQAAAAGYVTPPMRDSTAQILEDMAAQAVDRYNLVNTTMLQSSVEQYSAAVQLTQQEYDKLTAQKEATQGILNDAAASVASGVETRKTAVRRAIKRISDEGLTGFVDRAGRSWTPEAYVNMVTRTTVHNTAIQATQAFMQDYNTEVFQVSSHAGARPLCYPYQGKFYSWNNTAGEIELGNGQRVSYEPLNVTSYGEPAGLFGINCGHYPIPIIPGVTIPHGADNIQPEEENAKAYAESQEQRALERKIREAKRVVEMAGDTATKEDKAAVKEAQAEMREFIARTGRTRRYDREQIGGTPQTARTPRTPEMPVIDTPRAETPRNIFGEPVIWDEKMSGQRWDNAKETVETLTSEFNTKLKEIRLGAEKAAGAVQISGTIMQLNNPQTANVVHEFAHTISMSRQTKYGLYDEAAFWKEIRKTRNAYRRAVENGTTDKISTYEYAKTGEDAVDEFMAEAFAAAWLEENGIDRPGKYGNDLPFARLVLDIVKKYYGRRNTNVQS